MTNEMMISFFDLDHLYNVLCSHEMNNRIEENTATLPTKPARKVNSKRLVFPRRLYIMLEETSNNADGNEALSSWMIERGFIINNKEIFESQY